MVSSASFQNIARSNSISALSTQGSSDENSSYKKTTPEKPVFLRHNQTTSKTIPSLLQGKTELASPFVGTNDLVGLQSLSIKNGAISYGDAIAKQLKPTEQLLSAKQCRTQLQNLGAGCSEPGRFGTFVADLRQFSGNKLGLALQAASACEGEKCNILLASHAQAPDSYRKYSSANDVSFDPRPGKLPENFNTHSKDGTMYVPNNSKAPALFESPDGLYKNAANLLIKVTVDNVSSEFKRLLEDEPLLTRQAYDTFVKSGQPIDGNESVELVLAGISGKHGDTNEAYCDTVSRPGGTADPRTDGSPEGFEEIARRETKEELGEAAAELLNRKATWTHTAKNSTHNVELGSGVSVRGVRDNLSASIVNIEEPLSSPRDMLSLLRGPSKSDGEFKEPVFMRPHSPSEKRGEWAGRFPVAEDKKWAVEGFSYQTTAAPYSASIGQHTAKAMQSLASADPNSRHVDVSDQFEQYCADNKGNVTNFV